MRKLSKRDKILIVITIFAVAFFLANLFLIRPYINKFAELENEKENLKVQKQLMSMNILDNDADEENLEILESQFQEIGNQIIENKSFDEINEILCKEFAKYNLTIMRFEIKEKKADKVEDEEMDTSYLKTISVIVTAQGEIQNIYNLIDDFSKDTKTDVINFIITDEGQEVASKILINLEYVMYK